VLGVLVTSLLPQDVPLAEYRAAAKPLWDGLKTALEPAVLMRPLPHQARSIPRVGS
jgi:hypothetical protein